MQATETLSQSSAAERAQHPGWQFWIDRGGTFTDVIGLSPAGELHVRKVPSSAAEGAATDPGLAAARQILESAGGRTHRVAAVKVGTTVATNALLTPEIAREVCQRTGSAASLNGSIALIGTQYNLILKAVSCPSGNLVASTQAQVGDKNRVLDALGKVASEMRGKLGESLATIQKFDVPVEATTRTSRKNVRRITPFSVMGSAISPGWTELNGALVKTGLLLGI